MPTRSLSGAQDHMIPLSLREKRHPGVLVSDLERDGNCAKSGMMCGCSLVSVEGEPVKSHAHAIQLLEAEVRSDDRRALRVLSEAEATARCLRFAAARVAAPL